jgi:ketosteroid isomerase-like protein
MTWSRMRQLSVLPLLLIPVFACAPASGPQAEAEVTAVLDKFYGAMKTGDTVTAMSVIAPDALFVESGKLETRSEYETNHLPNDIAFEKQVTGKRGPLRITVLGDTAWVIAVTVFEGTFDGSPVDFESAQLAVLTRTAGEWQIRSIHWSSRRR